MPGLTSYFWHGDALRSRSVSNLVLSGTVNVPAAPERLTADWHREIAVELAMAPGDVETLPLARSRARARWPDYRRCVQAACEWTGLIGLPGVLAASEIALMACRGARYHHDGAQYSDSAFCNLFLSEDKGFDLHFPVTDQRIPLVRGTVVIFDTGQPHAVIRQGSSGFSLADFPPNQDDFQVFLSWELPIENPHVSRALHIAFDIDVSAAMRLTDQQLLLNGAPVCVCPASGRWCSAN